MKRLFLGLASIGAILVFSMYVVAQSEDAPKRKLTPEETSSPDFRTWTDSTGKHKVEALYEGMAPGAVKLRKEDGTTIQVPRESLSEKDQAWIKNREPREKEVSQDELNRSRMAARNAEYKYGTGPGSMAGRAAASRERYETSRALGRRASPLDVEAMGAAGSGKPLSLAQAAALGGVPLMQAMRNGGVPENVETDAFVAPTFPRYVVAGRKHWIKSKVDGGAFIQLEDGSLWQVSPIDKVNTALWLPIDEVIVLESNNPLYPYKLVGKRDAAEAKLVAGVLSGPVVRARDGEMDLFDSSGSAIVYIAVTNDMTFYLWSGKPCAYLDDDSVYGFNGNHLGWYRTGVVYDHDGHVVAALAEHFRLPVQPAPPKSLKELKPLKGLKELKPLKPLFSTEWSRTFGKTFFLNGRN